MSEFLSAYGGEFPISKCSSLYVMIISSVEVQIMKFHSFRTISCFSADRVSNFAYFSSSLRYSLLHLHYLLLVL